MELKAKVAAPVSGGTGGAERAFSGASGRTQEENIRWKDSRGGTLVYTHTRQEAKMENPVDNGRGLGYSQRIHVPHFWRNGQRIALLHLSFTARGSTAKVRRD
jgi:hypothetical protein